MEYKPVPPIEAFAEALSVPAMLHVSPIDEVTVLTFGQFALPTAKLALRYPNTKEVLLIGADAHTIPKDHRARGTRLEDVPADLTADLVTVAVPGDPTSLLESIVKHLKSNGILVVALDQLSRGRTVKNALREKFKHVLPYREHAPDPALFLLCSNRRLGSAVRPFPPNLKRLTPRYTQAMFDLAADEYALLFGQEMP